MIILAISCRGWPIYAEHTSVEMHYRVNYRADDKLALALSDQMTGMPGRRFPTGSVSKRVDRSRRPVPCASGAGMNSR